MKIKEALSLLLLIAFISVAAGGDYYYSSVRHLRKAGYTQHKTEEQHRSTADSDAHQLLRKRSNTSLHATAVVFTR
jgi:hypothetical protein